MNDMFELLGGGELISLRRDKVATTRHPYRGDEVVLACQRLNSFHFTIAIDSASKDAGAMQYADNLRLRERKEGDYQRYRRELTILPLQSLYGMINDNFAEHFGVPAKVARWNQLIRDWLIVSYGFFTDYLNGHRHDARDNRWHEIEPPRPEEATLAATDLSSMINYLTHAPYSKILSDGNKHMMDELYGHLLPHMEKAPVALTYKM